MPQYGRMGELAGPPSSTTHPPLLVIAGATATGKTELAVRVGEAVLAMGRPVVVISADSRQVYRGLDIGTAKVSAADRARVPHEGLDLVDPDATFTVADFAAHARAVLASSAAASGLAILVGGTGLYLRAVARGLDTEALPSDPVVRARLETELAADGLPTLVTRLGELAPTRLATIDQENPRRVVRALEIAELVGDGPLPVPRGYGGRSAWIGLRLDRPEHDRRIAQRAAAQFANGLVEEARALRMRFDPSLPAFSAIGYAEAWSVIDERATLAEAIERDALRNRQFAKRQATWFRSEPGIDWLDAAREDVADVASQTALRLLAAGTG
jgi:tRNA dimethylallyltransferase